MAKKFKINNEQSYTRTQIINDGDKQVAVNKTFSIVDSIKEIINSNNEDFEPMLIPLDKIEFNPLNEEYRSMTTDEEIRELANSIAVCGLLHNLVVKRNPNNPETYILISGEKRTLALRLLKEEGKDLYPRGVRANIIERELTQEEELILIHTANIMSRNFSQDSFIRLIAKYEELLKRATAETGEKVKNVNALIASISGKSERMVRRFRSIYNNLQPELLDAFIKGKIGQREAEEYMKLDEEGQKLVADSIKADKKLSYNEVMAIREAQSKNVVITEENVTNDVPEHQEVEDNSELKDSTEQEKKNKASERKVVAIELKDPGVKKRVMERELEKLYKSLCNIIEKYTDKENSYKEIFGEYSPHYEETQKIISTMFVEGDNKCQQKQQNQ